MDVSERTAQLLQFKHLGTARIKIDYLGPAALAGSDDTRLVASLNTRGPAIAPAGAGAPTMVASVEPVATARPAQSNALMSFSATSNTPTATPISRPAPENAGVITETRFTPVSNLPVPPPRPFDLDTIGGASVPVAPVATPPSRKIGSNAQPRSADLSFQPMDGGRSRFGKDHAFSRIGELEPTHPGKRT